jgi:hypothetical protein
MAISPPAAIARCAAATAASSCNSSSPHAKSCSSDGNKWQQLQQCIRAEFHVRLLLAI